MIKFNRFTDSTPFEAADLTEIRELLHPKNDDVELPYSIAHATVQPGRASVPHILEESSEAYHILSGTGRAYIGAQIYDMHPGDTVLIPAGVRQYIECSGTEPLTFLCVVAPPYEVTKDRRV